MLDGHSSWKAFKCDWEIQGFGDGGYKGGDDADGDKDAGGDDDDKDGGFDDADAADGDKDDEADE